MSTGVVLPGQTWSCDTCNKELKPGDKLYDAKSIGGSWAWMCATCWPHHSMWPGKFGKGICQEFIIKDDRTLEKLRS